MATHRRAFDENQDKVPASRGANPFSGTKSNKFPATFHTIYILSLSFHSNAESRQLLEGSEDFAASFQLLEDIKLPKRCVICPKIGLEHFSLGR